MPFVNVKGAEIFYEEAGDGPPVLLLGGTLSSATEDFGPQIATLSANMKVIAPDRLGYGRSRPRVRDFPDNFYQRDADGVVDIMDALGINSAALLGWSEGAAVSLCLARSYPGRVDRLVVWGAISEVRTEDLETFQARRDTDTWPEKAQKAMTAVYGETYWKQTWRDWCDVMVRLHAKGGDVKLGRIETISCPTLILHGKKDPLIAECHPRAIHARIKGSELCMIESGRHDLHLRHTSQFNDIVGAFLDAMAGGP